jgi:hypothetical protein
MYLVGDQRVLGVDQVILEPPPCNACGHYHHIPGRRLRGRLPLSVDYSDSESRSEDLAGNGPDAERFSSSGPCNNPEASTMAGEVPDLVPMLLLQNCVDTESHCQLYRLARRPGRRYHDDATGSRLGSPERFTIRW